MNDDRVKKEEKANKKSETALREEKILEFWKKNNIFQKSLEKKSPKGEFVFYDGPPFATGRPHYGHILPGTIKDVIPRYKTMQGYHVRRQWGWDCHGLPLENLVEKELGLKTKKEIEEYGVGNFNKKAKDSVLRYADDWRRIIPRTGRWVDMERDYRTMDFGYTESVWWVFKTLYEKGLIYKGFKSMHLCPRCETTLSNFEVNQGYKDVTDISVTVKLPFADDPTTSLLVWTTTPWTLPGNMAVAVNKNFDYVKIKITNIELKKDEKYILAKDRLEIVKYDYEIIEEFKGKELLGKRYKPPFDYYKNEQIQNKENAWKVYHADYVSRNDGTGIVHLAPAFGEEDMLLAKAHNIPLVHHVGIDGKFKKEVRDFAGIFVKPKENPQETDIEILKYLAGRNLLFAKEKVTHSYSHCWRCDTPLLNYAANSWFIKVVAIKEKIIKANKKIHWVPRDIRDGRFGKGLETAPDWAISRTRFWGAPLPVWKDEAGEETITVGSLEELKKYIPQSGNSYFIMRHGEAEYNTKNILNADIFTKNPLTKNGKQQIKESLVSFAEKNIDFIIYSPLQRTKETAEHVGKILGVDSNRIIEDVRLREIGVGEFEGKQVDAYHSFFAYTHERFSKQPAGGETWLEVKRRMGIALYELEKTYKNKNILIISHNGPLQMLQAVVEGIDVEKCVECINSSKHELNTAEIRAIDFVPIPHNDDFEIDLHRPYIDSLTIVGKNGKVLTRIPEVFDCWFESGSMPYGQFHYPYDNLDIFNPKQHKGFPAHFIAEGLDQTRGWFYSLLVLSVALFGDSPYKSVVVSGIVLGEDGRKMSKKLQNYPEISYALDQYGADALRYYLLSSPLVKAETLNFSEKGLKEIHSKVISRLRNVCSFYELYTANQQPKNFNQQHQSTNVLDKWILVKLNELVEKVSLGFDNYELDRAIRPIGSFVDDLSTWYIRRSRERFKSDDVKDKEVAMATTRYVLLKCAKVIAPIMPFVAEEIYLKVKDANEPESVHLSAWPKRKARISVWSNPVALIHRLFGAHKEINILGEMERVRGIVSTALQARTKAGVKVRQPLSLLQTRNKELKIRDNEQLVMLIKDEINVKKVQFGADIKEEIALDVTITPQLRKEGQVRELARMIQGLRKQEGLEPTQKVALYIKTGERGRKIIEEFQNEIKKLTSLTEIVWKDELSGESFVMDDVVFIAKLVY